MITGELLQKLRLMKGIKQETIAKKLGISQSRYSQLESKEIIDKKLFEKLVAMLDYTSEEAEAFKNILPPPLS